jgi:hypothetical protein
MVAVPLSQVELCKNLGTEMDFSMTYAAKGYEIFFHIAPQKTSRLSVMDLEISRTSASLASPAIALEHLLAKRVIGIPVQAKPGSSWDRRIHDAFGIHNKNFC